MPFPFSEDKSPQATALQAPATSSRDATQRPASRHRTGYTLQENSPPNSLPGCATPSSRRKNLAWFSSLAPPPLPSLSLSLSEFLNAARCVSNRTVNDNVFATPPPPTTNAPNVQFSPLPPWPLPAVMIMICWPDCRHRTRRVFVLLRQRRDGGTGAPRALLRGVGILLLYLPL